MILSLFAVASLSILSGLRASVGKLLPQMTVEAKRAKQRRDRETDAVDDVLLGIFTPPPPWLQYEPTPPRATSVPTRRGPGAYMGPRPTERSPRTSSPLSSPRAHVRAKDPNNGWHTYVARRGGPAEGARLPPLQRPRQV